ncbi:hypothetical protein [Robertkochia solimangrovi]|uniref:hypothetical protein n=1 Tax=Robertkochia solimangrovi TaxID=2213046 RepID=UPI00117C9B3A|nr:hypothetical protein [Robertkochia solimangrovi]TRZ41092.1 hypothetical protein DMZ48_18370 [Robertkochia solimangrovi]
MPRAMFEYTVTVLQKVSFDSILFCRELEKAAKRLLPHELDELRIWLVHYIQGKPQLSNSLIYLKV